MTHLITRYWLLLPLLICVVALLDRVELPDVIGTEDTINMSDTHSDYYMSDFRARRFGADGQIEYIVTGETLAHYPLDDHSKITAPRLELRRENVLWLVESERGRYDPTPDLFTLRGDVVIKRTLQPSDSRSVESDSAELQTLDKDVLVMTTNSLRIATNSNVVETDEMVNITAPTWQLQATGLRTAIDEGQLKLLSDVTGRYDMPVDTLQD